jgi:hypothetical protein
MNGLIHLDAEMQVSSMEAHGGLHAEGEGTVNAPAWPVAENALLRMQCAR